MKEKYLQRRINDYLDWIKLKYIHLTSFLSIRVKCPFCFKTFNRKVTVPGNKGLLDLIIFTKNKPLIIELKSKKGRLSLEQKEYIDYFKKKGYDVHIIKKFEEFEILFKKKVV